MNYEQTINTVLKLEWDDDGFWGDVYLNEIKVEGHWVSIRHSRMQDGFYANVKTGGYRTDDDILFKNLESAQAWSWNAILKHFQPKPAGA